MQSWPYKISLCVGKAKLDYKDNEILITGQFTRLKQSHEGEVLSKLMCSNIPDLPDLSVEFSSKIKRDTTANGQLKPIMNN